jgi:hypothetical protein
MTAKLALVPRHQPEPEEGTRPIQTVYYEDIRGRHPVKITRSRWALNAVPNCVKRMQLNEYGATLAEVYDTETGELHAVIRHTMDREIKILFQREVKEGM